MVPGTLQNNRWGLRGSEDLGGGSKAVFALESGFAIDDGKSQQGGRLFGRQAFVGLSNERYGTLTFGRQYDAVYDALDIMSAPVAAAGLATHVGDNDNVFGSYRHNNAIKYVTPDWGGLRGELSYALSDVSSAANNRSFSAGGIYEGLLRLAGAYLQLDNPGLNAGNNASGAVTDDYFGAPFVLFHSSPLNPAIGVRKQQVAGPAAGYGFGAARVNAMYTYVNYAYRDNSGLRLHNFDLNGTYHLTPSRCWAQAMYSLPAATVASPAPRAGTWPNSAGLLVQAHGCLCLWHLSEGRRRQSGYLSLCPSSNDRQLVMVAGIRHKF